MPSLHISRACIAGCRHLSRPGLGEPASPAVRTSRHSCKEPMRFIFPFIFRGRPRCPQDEVVRCPVPARTPWLPTCHRASSSMRRHATTGCRWGSGSSCAALLLLWPASGQQQWQLQCSGRRLPSPPCCTGPGRGAGTLNVNAWVPQLCAARVARGEHGNPMSQTTNTTAMLSMHPGQAGECLAHDQTLPSPLSHGQLAHAPYLCPSDS